MIRACSALCAGLLLFSVSARGQEAAASDPPAHVALVDGSAVLERDGRADSSPANMPLLAGDRIRTQAGRVEILFADGSALHLDTNTTVDFQSDELVRLLEGRVRLSIPGPDRVVSYRIDAPSAWAQIDRPGEYRVAVSRADGEIELAVLRGAAELVNEDGRTLLRAGERGFSRGNAAPSNAYVFNSAAWDAFDRWSEARRDERLGVSTQYLPDQVRPYAASFDRYGAWQYDSSYGYVWYPSVATGWRPYYNGRWVTLRPYGWTWVGADPWAWPTHHYGRWGISSGVWFWIPGRSWAPAWVSWAYAPGYVSWCPLGWNNRPIVQINVNTYGRGYDPWRAWTVVPRHTFGVGYVNARGVAIGAFDARTRESFVLRPGPPESRGYAVPRSSAPIRVAGTAAPRASTSPLYTDQESLASRAAAARSRTGIGQPRGSSDAPRAGATAMPADRERAVTRTMPDAGATGMAADRGRAVTRTVPDARTVPAAPTGAAGSYADPRVRQGTAVQPPAGGYVRSIPGADGRPRTDGPYVPGDRRAVPRSDRVYGPAPLTAPRQYGAPFEQSVPGAARPMPRAGEQPPVPGYEIHNRPAYPDGTPAGVRAMPRAPSEGSRPSEGPRPAEGPPPSEAARPSAPYRPGAGSERRGPDADRGGDRSSAPAAGAARPRSGGQQSSGTAVRRPGGGR